MSPRPSFLAAALALLAPSIGAAADGPPPEAAPAAASPQRAGEPAVQRIVTEDDNIRVEELRVRGETKRIVVQSRLGRDGKVRQYEVIPADNARDLSQGPAGNRGAAGQRVWHVLSF